MRYTCRIWLGDQSTASRAKAPGSINRDARTAASARPLSLSIARVLFGTHFVLLLSFYCFNLCAGALFACAQFVARPAHRAAANRARPANEARARRAAPAPARAAAAAAPRRKRCAVPLARPSTMLIVPNYSYFVLAQSSRQASATRLPPSDNFNVDAYIVILTEIPLQTHFIVGGAFRQSYSINHSPPRSYFKVGLGLRLSPRLYTF